jgi:hypothetical protein
MRQLRKRVEVFNRKTWSIKIYISEELWRRCRDEYLIGSQGKRNQKTIKK